jgi:hypothetical protein
MNNSIIDIIERFQRRYALQEEREMKNFDATGGAGAPGLPDKNGTPKNNIFETKDVLTSTVAVPASTEWSSSHDGLIAGGFH